MAERIQPSGWDEPRGYANGMRARGEIVAVAGQIAWDARRQLVSEDFVAQFEQALANVVEVVRTAGGRAEDLVSLTLYVVNVKEYVARRQAVGEAYRKIMGAHYPAMALVQIAALVDPGAKVEIQGLAVLPVTQSFRFELDGDGVAVVTLDRADRLNALTFEVYRELTDLFARLHTDDKVRAVVLTGAGRAFCSGGDVHDIIGELVKWDAPRLLGFTRMTGELIGNMRRCRAPIVAAVNGVAAGAGAVIALASDFRVMAESAKLAFLFVRVGLAGADMGAAYLLPRLVGLGRATELLMLGDSIPAAECARVGLASKVVPVEQVVDEARAVATRLARGPSFALAMTKKLLDAEMSMTLEQALEAEAQGQEICMQTRDFREAYRAFVEKRPPKFEGL